MNSPTHSPFAVEHATDSSGFLLWQVTTLWQRQIVTALHGIDLTHAQFVLLASTLWLSRTETHLTQVRIAKHAQLDIMMTSQVLRTLATKGLIQRTPHPTDSRAKVITLTDAGRALAFQAIPLVEGIDQHFFSSLTHKQADFNRLLNQLITHQP